MMLRGVASVHIRVHAQGKCTLKRLGGKGSLLLKDTLNGSGNIYLHRKRENDKAKGAES